MSSVEIGTTISNIDKIASRIRRIKPSETLAITNKAKAMKAEGIDVVSFAAGEPDFDTPDYIKEAAVEALSRGATKYTAVPGINELKEAICRMIRCNNDVEYTPEEIIVSMGAKHSIYNICQVLIDEGDEVIIHSPYWVSYPSIVELAGGVPVVLPCSEKNGFQFDVNDLKKLITPKTKAFILNTPCNPTGAVFSEDLLKQVAEVAVEREILIISDEIYDNIRFMDSPPKSIVTFGNDVRRLTLYVNGVSKSYSMTGWRIGYTAGDPAIVKEMSKLQSQSTSNPVSFAQWGAVAALLGPQQVVTEHCDTFRKRRDLLMEGLDTIEGITCFRPQGTFYAFPNVSALIGRSYNGKKIAGTDQLAQLLLEEARVVVVPGEGFGAGDHIRISFATSMEMIEKGLNRMRDFVSRLK
jgi:aspartate aminotransferase